MKALPDHLKLYVIVLPTNNWLLRIQKTESAMSTTTRTCAATASHFAFCFVTLIVDFNYGTNTLIFSSLSTLYFAVLKNKIVYELCE